MTVEKEIKNYAVSFENARVAHERYLLKQQNEDLLEAVNQYLQTMKANPKMAESYYRLASLMLESGDIDLENAIKVLDTMYRNDPQVAPKEIPSLVRCFSLIKKYKKDN